MKKNSFNSSTRKHSLNYSKKIFDRKETNFKNVSLTHSRFYNCTFPKINFKRAAVTGTIFENCTFENCNFDDADFEFCEFRHCTIDIKSISGCSFNNSNFFELEIKNTYFIGCTFTGAFFEKSKICNTNIAYSTLEGACFAKCKFEQIDWRELNLEYVEFVSPVMTNAILPFFQIPYMFGMLQYLSTTQDSVCIANKQSTISIDNYFEEGIPYLLDMYKKQQQYFPISNIYLFGRNTDYNIAFDYLSKEVSELAMARDFRGIKFCCKLMSSSHMFDRKHLNRLYKQITDVDVSLRPDSAEMKSFSRHIGEIRSILFERKKSPTLYIQLKANIGFEYSMRFANLLNQFQKIAKPNHTNRLNTSIKLSHNSPLLIDISIEGDTTYFASILYSFLILTGASSSTCLSYPLLKSFLAQHSDNNSELDNSLQLMDGLNEELKRDGIVLTMLEYYSKDCEEILDYSDKHHYINQNLLALSIGGM